MSTFALSPVRRSMRRYPRRFPVPPSVGPRVLLVTLGAVVLGLAVAVATLALGHADLLGQMEVFKGAKEIKGVTEFLEAIKGYLLSIALAGFTIAAIAAGTAKFVGHTKANDLVFNIGVGVAIFAAIPTLVA